MTRLGDYRALFAGHETSAIVECLWLAQQDAERATGPTKRRAAQRAKELLQLVNDRFGLDVVARRGGKP